MFFPFFFFFGFSIHFFKWINNRIFEINWLSRRKNWLALSCYLVVSVFTIIISRISEYPFFFSFLLLHYRKPQFYSEDMKTNQRSGLCVCQWNEWDGLYSTDQMMSKKCNANMLTSTRDLWEKIYFFFLLLLLEKLHLL